MSLSASPSAGPAPGASAPCEEPQALPAVGGGHLLVGPEACAFRLAGGALQRLHTRRALRLILQRLVQQHAAAPGRPLSVDALVETGWPGERMLPQSGPTRVYTAIRTLRRMGLEAVLQRREGGYFLVPHLHVEREASPAS